MKQAKGLLGTAKRLHEELSERGRKIQKTIELTWKCREWNKVAGGSSNFFLRLTKQYC